MRYSRKLWIDTASRFEFDLTWQSSHPVGCKQTTGQMATNNETKNGNGNRLVVRNGVGKERTILTGTEEIKIKAPRVNDRREGEKFTSSILPPYMRKCPNVESVRDCLVPEGAICKRVLGEGAKGLSKSTIHALKKSWDRDLKTWRQEKINDRFVYLWADGVYMYVGRIPRLGD